MKPSLQLRVSQSLTMTPQLQQAIKLLQLSSLELQAEIQATLDANPMLEVAESDEESEFADATSESPDQLYETRAESTASEAASSANADNEEHTLDAAEALDRDIVDAELPVDAQWEDWEFSTPGSQRSDEDDDSNFQGQTAESLQDLLLWQLNLTPFSDTDRSIAMAIIDAIDDDGYLRAEMSELLEAVNRDNDVSAAVEADEVQAVLHRLQQFDPPGIAARDLRECLLIQLKQMQNGGANGHAAPVIQDAIELVREHLEMLSGRDLKTLMRKSKLREEQIRAAIALVQSLNPRPGNSITRNESDYVTPDVLVSKRKGRWLVELNPDASPKLRVNTSYASLIQRSRTAADNQFLRNHLQEAKWFIKSLQSRNETLLRVATTIVEQQIGFFEQGEEAMKPMVLAQIAELLGMHESTISRVTTQKFMHTPRGIFELKYFFSSHLSTSDGGEASSTAIRALIKKLVAQEESQKPLSDSQIAQLLADQGFNVARRTVAKYREAMNIPSSSERKSFV